MTACPFTPKTLAERWECSPNHVLKLAREGKLSFFRIGKMYRFPVDAVEAYERGNTVTSCDRDDDRSEPVILDFPNTLRDVLRATREDYGRASPPIPRPDEARRRREVRRAFLFRRRAREAKAGL